MNVNGGFNFALALSLCMSLGISLNYSSVQNWHSPSLAFRCRSAAKLCIGRNPAFQIVIFSVRSTFYFYCAFCLYTPLRNPICSSLNQIKDSRKWHFLTFSLYYNIRLHNKAKHPTRTGTIGGLFHRIAFESTTKHRESSHSYCIML